MPLFLDYFVAIKFVPSIFFMVIAYNYFEKRFNKKIAWYVGIPVGIFAFVTFVQIYYGIVPIPLVGGGQFALSIKDSLIGGYAVHAFDFLAAWLIVTGADVLKRGRL